MIKHKSFIPYLIIILISVILIFFGHKICKFNNKITNNFCVFKATVIDIINNDDSDNKVDHDKISSNTIYFKALINSGESNGQIVECTKNIASVGNSDSQNLKKGDQVILAHQSDDFSLPYTFLTFNRENSIIFLFMIFLILIIILGRKKGTRTIISLVITFSFLFLVYIPSVLKGFNIYLMTSITVLFIIISSLTLINGINCKTLCAAIGNTLGVTFSALVCLVMNNLLKITGFISEDYTTLLLINDNIQLDLSAIVWAGVVIGSLGAIMDISMTIASSMYELATHMQEKTFEKLFHSGMNIGKDSIGTMTNTLILAYLGSSFAEILIYIAVNANLAYLFNLESTAVQILQSLVGSIGILICVPITVLICTYFDMKHKNESDKALTHKKTTI